MVTATVSRKFIDDGVHEPGDKIDVSEVRYAELCRMSLVVKPDDQTSEPAIKSAQKGKS